MLIDATSGIRTVDSEVLSSEHDFRDSRDYYTNLIHAYPAKMYREIARSQLSNYAKKGDTILDPFCGTGTVLMQAKLYGMNAVGFDINPLAALIARVKATSLNFARLTQQAELLFQTIENFNGDIVIPKFLNIDFWFEKQVKKDLAKILYCIKRIRNKKYRDFFSVCFSSIIRKVSNADPRISPPVKSKKMRKLIENGRIVDTLSSFKQAVNKNLKRLDKFCSCCDRSANLNVWTADSRQLLLADESIDLVITSPPYVGAQKYVRSTRLELLWLNMASSEALREIDHDTIGSETLRASEVELKPTSIEFVDDLVRVIGKVDRERAYMVQKYFVNMKQIFAEIWRVLKDGKQLVIVIGNNTVRGRKIPSSRILGEIAKDIGFVKEKELVDPIRYRGLMQKRNKTAGIVECERILVFRK